MTFKYTTGDATGQNMVSIWTDQLCQFIIANTPIQPERWYIESNYSGDKKATARVFSNVRGKKITFEIIIPKAICEKTLRTTPIQIARYCQTFTIAAIQSGAIGAQGNIANGLTVLFIASEKDVPYIAKSAISLTRMEVYNKGYLYVA